MEYQHPKRYLNKYTGSALDTERMQNRIRYMVEQYCLKCDKFCGQQHNFEECGLAINKSLEECPKGFNMVVPFDVSGNPDDWIKCKVDD